NGNPNPVAVNTNQLNNLAPGQYLAQIANSITGCSLNKGFQVLDNKQLPSFYVEKTDNTTCQNFNGTATVGGISSNEMADYTFFWYYGNVATGNPINVNSDYDLDNLSPGAYTVVGKNITSQCEGSLVIIIADDRVIPEISAVTTDNGICEQQ